MTVIPQVHAAVDQGLQVRHGGGIIAVEQVICNTD
jgi:hypothetical protein